MKQNLHPSVYAGSIHIFPPMRSIISWQIDNPSPDPCAVSFSFSKRLKMFACFSGGIPQPVSVTEKSAYSSDCNSTSRVMLPSTVNLVALMSRLMSNCCKRESSVYSEWCFKTECCPGLFYFVNGIDYIVTDGNSIVGAETEFHFAYFKIAQVDYVINQFE